LGWGMTKRPLLRALSFGCAVLLSTSCLAATLEPTQGDLSINRGKGFKPVKHRIVAHVGDSVMVGPSGGGRLVYSDGCKVDVIPGAVLTVTQLSPCASGSMAQNDNRNWWDMTPQQYGFWAVWGAAAGFIIYEALSP
jgi:hypothetical protein